MSSPFDAIDSLKSEWDRLQPMSPDNERRLWQKLRLEWNFHSNHIEGDTLTYGETELLLLHDQTTGNHTLREYEEMKAHDVGIAHVRTLAADPSRLIGEGDIRDLNKIILKEPYWKPARTPDGEATRKQIIPGTYKTAPNNVITATGELFEFAPPSEIPARMEALTTWLAESVGGGDSHLVEIAAKLHHDFVLIHPFDDGNGRVARMLVNYLFLRCGCPPIIVPTQEKSAYLAALRLADAGDIAPLTAFLAGRLEIALQLGIRAAMGENIAEPSDVEKEVALFVRGEQARRGELGLPTKEMLAALMKESLIPFVDVLERKLEGLKPLFSDFKTITVASSEAITGGRVSRTELDNPKPGGQVRLLFQFLSYNGEAATPFDQTTRLALNFPPGKYTITFYGKALLSKSYAEPLLSAEIEEITAHILAKTFAEIRAKAGVAE